MRRTTLVIARPNELKTPAIRVSAFVSLVLLVVVAGITSLVTWSLDPFRMLFSIVVLLPLAILHMIWTFLTG